MRLAVIVALGTIAAACASGAPTEAPAAAADGDRVCKRTTPMGSNLSKSECHTKDEWAAIEKRDQEGVKDFGRALDQTTSAPQ